MQTFLPHPNFLTSAHSLDSRRLGKQIVEVGQMLAALRQGPGSDCKECGGQGTYEGERVTYAPIEHRLPVDRYVAREVVPVACASGIIVCSSCTDGTRPTPWWSHPATQAWLGYEPALATYGQACLTVYVERGRNLERYENQRKLFVQTIADNYPSPIVHPPWVGYEPFHAGHLGHLYRKDPGAYYHLSANEGRPLLYPVIVQRGVGTALVRYAARVERAGKPSLFRLWPGGTETHKTARAAVLGSH